MSDKPLAELLLMMDGLIEHHGEDHVKVYQKFTCSGCGARQTMDVPNTIFLTGKCEECGDVTDCQERGGGLAVWFVGGHEAC